jgi:hypothetical protein
MFDKIYNNLHWVFAVVAVILVAAVCYGLGEQSNKNKICNQIGGVYVKTYQGYRCIHAAEIEL